MAIPRKTRVTQTRYATFVGDESLPARIWYDGPGIGTVDLTTDATREMNFLVGGSADTNVNSDGIIDFDNDVTTAGTLADLINATAFWHMTLIDTLRATSWENWIVFSALQVTIDAPKAISANNGTDPPDAVILAIGPEAAYDFYGNAAARISSEQNNLSSRDPGTRSASLPSIIKNGELADREQRFPNVSRITEISGLFGNGTISPLGPIIEIYSSTQDADTLLASIHPAEDTAFSKTFVANEIESVAGSRLVIVVDGSANAGTLDVANLTVKGSFGAQGEILSCRSQL